MFEKTMVVIGGAHVNEKALMAAIARVTKEES